MPILSLIIPVYNGESFISKCLNSIYKTTYDSNLYEVLIINDGTPDSTIEVIEKNFTNNDNLFVFTQENKGLGGARNLGLQKAKGDYVWFIDQDDWITDGAIERICSILRENYTDILFFDYTYPNGKKSGIKNHAINEGEYNGIDFLNQRNVESPVWQYIISNKVIKKYNLRFFPGYHEDSLFTPIILFLSEKVVYHKNINYVYNLRQDSITTSTNPLQHCIDLLEITERLIEFHENKCTNYSEKKILMKYSSICFFSIFYYWLKLNKEDKKNISKALSTNLFLNLIRYNPKVNHIVKFVLMKIK